MFNENYLLGSYGEYKLDFKRRMFIPASTGVEPGEQLAIKVVEFDNEACIKLEAYQKISGIINSLIEKRNQTTDFKEFEKYEKMIMTWCYTWEALVKVDSQHRITLPEATLKKINATEDSNFEAIGVGNALILKKQK